MVISDQATKTNIRHIIEDEEEINYAKRMGQTWVTDLKPLATTWEKPYLDIAPYLVVVFKQSYGHTEDGARRIHYYNELSTAISVGILLCAIQVWNYDRCRLYSIQTSSRMYIYVLFWLLDQLTQERSWRLSAM